jgi:hypothetical protein
MRSPLLLLPLAFLAAPLLAQSADKPLGDILESIEQAAPPAPVRSAPPVEHAPVPPTGVGTTPLPPSRVEPPFGPPTPEPALADEMDGPSDAVPVERTEAEKQAAWEAAERVRLEALDRAHAARVEAARRAHEAAMAEYQQRLAEREAAIAGAEADYRAALERNRLKAERERALWEARVRACLDGDRDACARPGEY